LHVECLQVIEAIDTALTGAPSHVLLTGALTSDARLTHGSRAAHSPGSVAHTLCTQIRNKVKR